MNLAFLYRAINISSSRKLFKLCIFGDQKHVQNTFLHCKIHAMYFQGVGGTIKYIQKGFQEIAIICLHINARK
jgi:hypothetical protein